MTKFPIVLFLAFVYRGGVGDAGGFDGGVGTGEKKFQKVVWLASQSTYYND